jgi:hypothetical protein
MADVSDFQAVAKYMKDLEERVAKLEEFCAGAYLWIMDTSVWLKAHADGGGQGVDPPKPPPPTRYP